MQKRKEGISKMAKNVKKEVKVEEEFYQSIPMCEVDFSTQSQMQYPQFTDMVLTSTHLKVRAYTMGECEKLFFRILGKNPKLEGGKTLKKKKTLK